MSRCAKGFSLLETLIAVTTLLILMAIGYPAYQNNKNARAAQGAAILLKSLMRERKLRAVSIGTYAGLCVGESQAEIYEWGIAGVNPISTPPYISFTYDWHQQAIHRAPGAPPVSLTVTSTVPTTANNQCGSLTPIGFSPSPDTSGDWEGNIVAHCGGTQWRVTAGEGGEISDGPY